jgi:type I restriction enzyme R subunit
LKRVAKVATTVYEGGADDIPEALKRSPGLRAIYNNLKPTEPEPMESAVGDEPREGPTPEDTMLALAISIDRAIREVRPADWRGNDPRQNIIKAALLPLLGSQAEVERLFLIVQAQAEY